MMLKKIFIFACTACCALMLCTSCGEKTDNKEIAVPIYEAKQISYKTAKAEIT